MNGFDFVQNTDLSKEKLQMCETMADETTS